MACRVGKDGIGGQYCRNGSETKVDGKFFGL